MLTKYATLRGPALLATFLMYNDSSGLELYGDLEDAELWHEKLQDHFETEHIECIDAKEYSCFDEDPLGVFLHSDIAEYTFLLRYPAVYRTMKVVQDPKDPGTNADHFYEDDPAHAVLKYASRYCKGSDIHRVRFDGLIESCETEAEFTVIIPRYGKLPETDPVYFKIKDPVKHKNWA